MAGPDQASWFERLAAEHNNLATALAWSLERREAETALRLGAALWPYWYAHGHVTEGRRWLEEALRLPGGAGASAIRARALVGAGRLASTQADYARAARCYDEGLALARACGDTGATAAALAWKGKLVAREASQEAAAAVLFAESLALAREADDKAGMARVLQWMGRLEEGLSLARELGDTIGVASLLCDLGDQARCVGDDTTAARRYDESLALFRELHHQQGIASALHNLGHLALHGRNPGLANERFQGSLAIFREIGHTWSAGDCLVGLAGVAVARGDAVHAAHLLGAAQTLQQPLGGHRSEANQVEYESIVRAVQAQLDTAAFAVTLAEGQRITPDQAVDAKG